VQSTSTCKHSLREFFPLEYCPLGLSLVLSKNSFSLLFTCNFVTVLKFHCYFCLSCGTIIHVIPVNLLVLFSEYNGVIQVLRTFPSLSRIRLCHILINAVIGLGIGLLSGAHSEHFDVHLGRPTHLVICGV